MCEPVALDSRDQSEQTGGASQSLRKCSYSEGQTYLSAKEESKNPADLQCHGCQQAWRWHSGVSLRCPHCHQTIQIEAATYHRESKRPHELTEYPDLRRQRSRKSDVMVCQASDDAEPVYYEALTKRQTEVLYALAEGGLTTRQIGEKLGISRHTVDKHLSEIYGKLGLAGRSEAILWALGRR